MMPPKVQGGGKRIGLQLSAWCCTERRPVEDHQIVLEPLFDAFKHFENPQPNVLTNFRQVF
jgi:hypothetical protein